MTIRIINECNQYCTHCMQQSGPNVKDIMSIETFENTLNFINKTTTKNINISGGEPTLHTNLLEFLKLALKSNKPIVLLTNGIYLIDNPELRHEIFCLMVKHKNLFIQVTSVNKIYTRYIKKSEFIETLKKLVIFKKVKDRVTFEDKISNAVVPIGRAMNNVGKFQKMDLRLNSNAPRCFNMYNALQYFNGNLVSTISHVKDHSLTSMCIPLVIENGDVIFGEYGGICSSVYNVNLKDEDPNIFIDDIVGPCGSCYVSKMQERAVNDYLFMYINKHNKINDSYLYKIAIPKGEEFKKMVFNKQKETNEKD